MQKVNYIDQRLMNKHDDNYRVQNVTKFIEIRSVDLPFQLILTFLSETNRTF